MIELVKVPLHDGLGMRADGKFGLKEEPMLPMATLFRASLAQALRRLGEGTGFDLGESEPTLQKEDDKLPGDDDLWGVATQVGLPIPPPSSCGLPLVPLEGELKVHSSGPHIPEVTRVVVPSPASIVPAVPPSPDQGERVEPSQVLAQPQSTPTSQASSVAAPRAIAPASRNAYQSSLLGGRETLQRESNPMQMSQRRLAATAPFPGPILDDDVVVLRSAGRTRLAPPRVEPPPTAKALTQTGQSLPAKKAPPLAPDESIGESVAPGVVELPSLGQAQVAMPHSELASALSEFDPLEPAAELPGVVEPARIGSERNQPEGILPEGSHVEPQPLQAVQTNLEPRPLQAVHTGPESLRPGDSRPVGAPAEVGQREPAMAESPPMRDDPDEAVSVAQYADAPPSTRDEPVGLGIDSDAGEVWMSSQGSGNPAARPATRLVSSWQPAGSSHVEPRPVQALRTDLEPRPLQAVHTDLEPLQLGDSRPAGVPAKVEQREPAMAESPPMRAEPDEAASVARYADAAPPTRGESVGLGIDSDAGEVWMPLEGSDNPAARPATRLVSSGQPVRSSYVEPRPLQALRMDLEPRPLQAVQTDLEPLRLDDSRPAGVPAKVGQREPAMAESLLMRDEPDEAASVARYADAVPPVRDEPVGLGIRSDARISFGKLPVSEETSGKIPTSDAAGLSAPRKGQDTSPPEGLRTEISEATTERGEQRADRPRAPLRALDAADTPAASQFVLKVPPEVPASTSADALPQTPSAEQWEMLAQHIEGALDQSMDGNAMVHLRVEPATLGAVHLEVVLDNDQHLRARFVTESARVKELIEGGFPHLQRRLQAGRPDGTQVVLEVVVDTAPGLTESAAHAPAQLTTNVQAGLGNGTGGHQAWSGYVAGGLGGMSVPQVRPRGQVQRKRHSPWRPENAGVDIRA